MIEREDLEMVIRDLELVTWADCDEAMSDSSRAAMNVQAMNPSKSWHRQEVEKAKERNEAAKDANKEQGSKRPRTRIKRKSARSMPSSSDAKVESGAAKVESGAAKVESGDSEVEEVAGGDDGGIDPGPLRRDIH